MGWYKTVTYRKTLLCANNTTELGRVISFLLVRKSFSTTVSNDLSRANQIDMTGPNSVVLFAQTLVCSLCNYYLDFSISFSIEIIRCKSHNLLTTFLEKLKNILSVIAESQILDL